MRYEEKTLNRGHVVVGAILIQLALGAIYAWSVFTAQLTDSAGLYAFTASQTAWVFSTGLATFATVMVLAGRVLPRVGPRPLTIVGGLMLGQQGNERVGNSYSPRIRHASVSWDRWTVGQTWTNFFSTSALPDYLAFIGPVGVTFARQAQIRYTAPTANGSWSFSLENPETTLTPYGGGPRIDADDSSVPDLVVRRNWTGDWGNISIAGLVRELKINEMGRDDSEVGGAISLAGKFELSDGDDVRWQVNYGNALGRYMGLNSFNVGALDATNKIVLTRQYGVLVAYKHLWTKQLHSSVGASLSGAANDTAISGLLCRIYLGPTRR